MKPGLTLFFTLLGGCFLLPGCVDVPKASGITVSVTGFQPAVSSPGATRAIMTLRFTSENVNALAFSGSTHQLYLNGNYVGKAESNTPVGVTPLGTATVDVPFVLENPAEVRLALAASNQGETSYRLESVLYFTDANTKFRLKASYEGRVDLHGLEAAAR